MSGTYQFDVMIKQTYEGEYLAAIPVLPGCISTGKTADEARNKVVEAARCYCWNMLENGASIPQVVAGQPTVRQVSIRLGSAQE